MKRPVILGLSYVVFLWGFMAMAQAPQMNFTFDTPYGSNSTVGKYVMLNDAQIYYEEYGAGEPLLLIHGNGGSIQDMGNQIEHFKSKFRVIIADNRGHGKSELKTDSLTYTQITKDWEALAAHLKLNAVHVIGWSDGGIVGLMMGINQKTKLKKLVAMGANLRPDTTAVYPFAVKWLKQIRPGIDAKIKEKDSSRDWNIQKQHMGLLGDQPRIPVASLSEITAPTLIMAGDKDIIREEHTIEIYQHIKQAQLCIFPGETHFIPASDPELFNATVEKFLLKPFTRPNSDFTKWN